MGTSEEEYGVGEREGAWRGLPWRRNSSRPEEAKAGGEMRDLAGQREKRGGEGAGDEGEGEAKECVRLTMMAGVVMGEREEGDWGFEVLGQLARCCVG